MKNSVDLVEVSPRDGLQNESRHLETADKLALITRVVAAGARRVEVTGFARPDAVPAMADAEAVAAGLPDAPGIEFSGLVVNVRSCDRALAAGMRALNMVVVASETFSQRNQRRSTQAVLAETREIGRTCAAEGVRFTVTVATAFGCPFEGEISKERLRSVLGEVAEADPDEVSLADTIGVGTPGDVAERFALLAQSVPGVAMRAHFHDTRSTGVANAVAAVEAGVRVLDASLGGIGGCPFAPAATGNVATEDLVYCLERMGVATGYELDRLIEDAGWLRGLLGKPATAGVQNAGGFPSAPRGTAA